MKAVNIICGRLDLETYIILIVADKASNAQKYTISAGMQSEYCKMVQARRQGGFGRFGRTAQATQRSVWSLQKITILATFDSTNRCC